jgi:hypothetical protein
MVISTDSMAFRVNRTPGPVIGNIRSINGRIGPMGGRQGNARPRQCPVVNGSLRVRCRDPLVELCRPVTRRNHPFESSLSVDLHEFHYLTYYRPGVEKPTLQ